MDSIVSGSYDGNTFVQRVLDHLSSQDEPIGGNPPTCGDLFRGKTRDGPLGYLGRPPEPKASGVATPQVSSVVQVTRSRGGPATGRCGARASEQAGKALRSQGHQCAHVM